MENSYSHILHCSKVIVKMGFKWLIYFYGNDNELKQTINYLMKHSHW